MAELAQRGTAYEVVEGEPPESSSRNLTAAGQLLAGATAFFFLAFVFAYFYLRSLNSAGLWQPKHVDAVGDAGGRSSRSCSCERGPRPASGSRTIAPTGVGLAHERCSAALVLGVVGLVLQVVAWTQQAFGPADGGYASVFFGWTAFVFLFVLGTLFWLETVLATSHPLSRLVEGRGHGSARPRLRRSRPDGRRTSATRSRSCVPSSDALSFYWTFLAGIVVPTWIVLYLSERRCPSRRSSSAAARRRCTRSGGAAARACGGRCRSTRASRRRSSSSSRRSTPGPTVVWRCTWRSTSCS